MECRRFLKWLADYPRSPSAWYFRTALELGLVLMLTLHMIFHPVVSYSLPHALQGEEWIPVWQQMEMIEQLEQLWKEKYPQQPCPLQQEGVARYTLKQ